ncbi:MAG: hypothetical protein ACP5U1_10455 [Desulfomonilaceae bacterium]
MDSIIDSLIELINMAQRISDSGFDTNAFISWKALAFVTLFSLLGPFNYYTRRFCHFTADSSRKGLMAGEGVLIAVKELLARRGFCCKALESLPEALNPTEANAPWVEGRKKWRSLDSIKQML